MLQKCIFCFAFLKFGKLEMVFSEARFLYLDERKKQPLINLREEPWKLFGNENQHGWNLEILHQAFYVHLHKRKLLSLSFGLFFAEILLSLLLDNTGTSCTHCHTNAWSHLILLQSITVLLCKASWHAGTGPLGFGICKSGWGLRWWRWQYF